MSGVSKILYGAEFASQNSKTVNTDFTADYLILEAGGVLSGIKQSWHMKAWVATTKR
ncbi:MAG: hypothetical protein ACJA13_003314 [Paraglaciecola sp.]|jgi:hypothetical protein